MKKIISKRTFNALVIIFLIFYSVLPVLSLIHFGNPHKHRWCFEHRVLEDLTDSQNKNTTQYKVNPENSILTYSEISTQHHHNACLVQTIFEHQRKVFASKLHHNFFQHQNIETLAILIASLNTSIIKVLSFAPKISPPCNC